VLCSVVKHLGSGRALKREEKTLNYVSSFSLHFFGALPSPTSFTTEESTFVASLFVKVKNLMKYPASSVMIRICSFRYTAAYHHIEFHC